MGWLGMRRTLISRMRPTLPYIGQQGHARSCPLTVRGAVRLCAI